MNGLQEQALFACRRREYDKAISLFTRAISSAPSVQLLDGRAACYQKSGELPRALQDAKAAIKLQHADPTGYLRAGNVLIKMGKPTVALEVYTHGLSRVRHIGQGYETLRKAHQEMMHELCPPKSKDPLTQLPRELAEMVLSYLTFKQRMNACMVSKEWAGFIRSVPELWQHLDLFGARGSVRNAFLSRAINCGRHKLTAASLGNLYDVDKTLTALFKYCAVEELVIGHIPLQGESLVCAFSQVNCLKSLKICTTAVISGSIVPRLCAALPTLETFECHLTTALSYDFSEVTSHNLRVLSLKSDMLSNDLHNFKFFYNIDTRMPNLESLTVHHRVRNTQLQRHHANLSRNTRLRHLDLCVPIGLIDNMVLPPSLISLSLHARNRAPGSHAFRDRIFYLPRLEKLSIQDTGPSIANDIAKILNIIPPACSTESVSHDSLIDSGRIDEPANDRSISELSELSFRSLAGDEEEPIPYFEMFNHLRLNSLKRLAMFVSEQIRDDTIAVVTQALPKLRFLDIRGTDVTGVGIKELVMAGHLEELNVSNCRRLNVDAVEWARSKGVRVIYKMTKPKEVGKSNYAKFFAINPWG